MNSCRNIEIKVFYLINMARKQDGKKPVRLDRGLCTLAINHSRDMAWIGYIYHGENDKLAKKHTNCTLIKRIFPKKYHNHMFVAFLFFIVIGLIYPVLLLILLAPIIMFGIPIGWYLLNQGWGYENVAYTYRGWGVYTDYQIAKSLHEDWMESIKHRENILNPDHICVGIGVARHKNKFYGTELFYH